MAHQLFYDRLLADYAEFPRTIVLSSHLIDEVANFLEHVILIDNGKIILDEDVEKIRGSAVNIAGPSARVESFATGRTVSHREGSGALLSLTVEGKLSQPERQEAAELGLEVGPVSLQQLVIRATLEAGATSGIDRTRNESAKATKKHPDGSSTMNRSGSCPNAAH